MDAGIVSKKKSRHNEGPNLEAVFKAIHRSMAVIEFRADGTILTANQNFLDTIGYTLSEIQGQHHRMFMAEDEIHTTEYQQFWQSLSAGKFFSGTFLRVGKGGRVRFLCLLGICRNAHKPWQARLTKFL